MMESMGTCTVIFHSDESQFFFCMVGHCLLFTYDGSLTHLTQFILYIGTLGVLTN